jgi:hypothetical protein
LTECDDLSEAEEMETAVVAVKTAEMAEALETAVVTLMTAVLTIKAAAAAVTALIEAAVTERVAVVYRRGRWFVSNVSDVRTMWNITSGSERYEFSGGHCRLRRNHVSSFGKVKWKERLDSMRYVIRGMP